MDSKEYKRIIQQENVLDFQTLIVTREALEKASLERLSSEIKRILQNNKIEKPLLHNNTEDQNTDHYRIDLTIDDISNIVSMFGDLEVESLGLNYETTAEASFYANMLDRWNGLPEYR